MIKITRKHVSNEFFDTWQNYINCGVSTSGKGRNKLDYDTKYYCEMILSLLQFLRGKRCCCCFYPTAVTSVPKTCLGRDGCVVITQKSLLQFTKLFFNCIHIRVNYLHKFR